MLIPALIGGQWARDLNVSAPESPYLAFIVGLPSAIDPFARGPAEKAGPGQGAGLGLAIVRATAEAHGGRAAAAKPGRRRGARDPFLHLTR